MTRETPEENPKIWDTVNQILLGLVIVTGFLGIIGQISRASAAEVDLSQRFSAHQSGADITLDHQPWDAFLAKYVFKGSDGLNRVGYGDVSPTDAQALKTYIRSLEAVDVDLLDRPEQFAYWANLYNATTIDLIIDNYPVASIRKIKLGGLFSTGPWKQKLLTVVGIELSLDDIEHEILRKAWSDPRVHYAVNCASISCPNLKSSAYRGVTLEADLDQAARDYINHPRAVLIEGGKLKVSSIYGWFKVDFGANDAGVIDHLRKYATPDLAAKLKDVTKISSHHYDWGLNDATGPVIQAKAQRTPS